MPNPIIEPQTWSNDAALSGSKVDSQRKVDVVVVGAGFSGLQAAYDLHKAGLSCTVLEARHRIGGRSYTAPLKSGPGIIELGSTWINEHTQPEVYALAKDFGLDFVEQNGLTKSVIQDHHGVVWSERGELVPQPPGGDPAGVEPLLKLLDEFAAKIDVSNPGAANKVEDDMTMHDWLMGNTNRWNREFIANGVKCLVGRDAKEVGLYYMMDYMKSGGGLQHLAGEGPGTAQHLKIKQGTSAIAHGLAKALPQGSVLVNSPVKEITQQSKGGILVATTNGVQIEAARVIVAIPTNTYTNIQFTPPLPQAKSDIVSRTMPGVYAKIIITYRRPWWRDFGLIGTFIGVRGPFNYSWELEDPGLGLYHLAAFVAGPSNNWFQLPRLEQEQTLLKHLVEMVPQANKEEIEAPLEINIQDWSKEEWIGGGPTSTMGPGDYAKYSQALREPFGNVHFAGGELAFEWKGYLEGAVRSGSRAAAEVIHACKLLS